MKRFELLNDKNTALDAVMPICDALEEKVGCRKCPFTDRYYPGNNGVMDYLMEEVEE